MVGLRYSRNAKDGKFISFISFFSMAGIALGVMSLIVVLSVMDGFESILKQRILGAVPHITIQAEKDSMTVEHMQKITQELNISDQVLQYLPLVQSQAIIQMPGDLKGVLAQGLLDQNSIPLGIQNSLTQGSWQGLLDNKFGIVIGQFMAMEYGLSIGDKIKLMISGQSHYTPLGRMPVQRNFTVVGFFETESEIDSQLVLIRAKDLNRLLKQPLDHSDGVRLVLSDAFLAQSLQTKLSQYLDKDTFKVDSWHVTHGKLFDAVRMEKNMMWFMLSLIIAVAAFNIVSALVMMVTQKQNEVAILKTLGMKPSTVRNIFIVQGAYNGILGAFVGASTGVIVSLYLNDFMLITGINLLGVPGVGLPMLFDWSKVLSVFGLAIVLSLIASIYPAKKASTLLPAEVLRHE